MILAYLAPGRLTEVGPATFSIGNAANLVNPERFVLGGGVTKSGERWWDTVCRVARETALPQIHFDVVPAALGDDAPSWGAVALAEDCLRAA